MDVDNSTFHCNKFHKRSFPVKLFGATGGLIRGQTPFICGGNDRSNMKKSRDCYNLNETGRWTKDTTAILNTTTIGFASTGSVVLNNSLVVSGYSGPFLTSFELVSPNRRPKSLTITLPLELYDHCMVKWDSETFMVIGGRQNTKKNSRIRAETIFINIRTNTLKNGPPMNITRYAFACGEMKVQGESYIVVSGGVGRAGVQLLNKGKIAQGWQKGKLINKINHLLYIFILGPDLPFEVSYHQMVASPNKRYLYAMGGSIGFRKEMYKLICTGTIDTCKWTEISGGLKRYYFVAIPIPNALAHKLCN